MAQTQLDLRDWKKKKKKENSVSPWEINLQSFLQPEVTESSWTKGKPKEIKHHQGQFSRENSLQTLQIF